MDRRAIDTDGLDRLRRNGIALREDRITRLEGRERLERIVFEHGVPLARHTLFFATGQSQRAKLTPSLGCELTDKGTVRTSKYRPSGRVCGGRRIACRARGYRPAAGSGGCVRHQHDLVTSRPLLDWTGNLPLKMHASAQLDLSRLPSS